MEKMTYQNFCEKRNVLIKEKKWEKLDKHCQEHPDYLNREADAIYEKSKSKIKN